MYLIFRILKNSARTFLTSLRERPRFVCKTDFIDNMIEKIFTNKNLLCDN